MQQHGVARITRGCRAVSEDVRPSILSWVLKMNLDLLWWHHALYLAVRVDCNA